MAYSFDVPNVLEQYKKVDRYERLMAKATKVGKDLNALELNTYVSEGFHIGR